MSSKSALGAFIWPLSVFALLLALWGYVSTLGGGHPDGGIIAVLFYVAVALPIASLIGLWLSISAYRKSPRFKGFALALCLMYSLGVALPFTIYLALLLLPGKPLLVR